MSNQLKKRLQKPEKPRVWCLSKEDWDKMAALLIEAERVFKEAQEVTREEWTLWTAEFGEGQGFPSIIYHDKPIIVRQPGSHKST